MRVLHVIPSLSLTQGGPSVALPLMERALSDVGVEVTVATTDDDGVGAHLQVPLGMAVEAVGSTRYFFRKQTERYKCSFPMQGWLAREVRGFDIVHVHEPFSFSSIAASRCSLREGVPYIVRPLGVLNRYGMINRRRILKALSFRLVEAPLLRAAAAIHYTSEREKAEATSLGVRTDSFVAPIGLDLDSFRSLPDRDLFFNRWETVRGSEIILFLSRLSPKKGLDLLIRSFAAVSRRRPDARLVIAGDGDESFVAGLKQLADGLGVSKRVLWTGFLDGADKLAALAAADVFVLPSYSENFGIAAVESLAAGVPTVLTHSVAISSDVAEAGSGICVAERPDAIEEAIVELLANPERAREMAARGQALAYAEYSMQAMGRNLRSQYERILTRWDEG